MGIEMAEMKFRVSAVWNKKSGFKDYTKEENVDSKKQKSNAKLKANKSKKAQKVADEEMEEPEEELELN